MAVPRGVLLDLDDTLYPERAYFESGLTAVATWLGDADAKACDDWRRRLFDDVAMQGRDGVLDRVPCPSDRAPEGWRAALLHTYRTHAPAISAFDDVEAFVAKARREGCRLALVTDGKSCVQWRKLRALGVERWLDAVVCTDDIDAPKPAAPAFLAAAALLGLAAQDCVYLADDPAKDFIGPNRLGMASMQVRRDLPFPLARRAPDDGAQASHQVASLAEAAQLLFGAPS